MEPNKTDHLHVSLTREELATLDHWRAMQGGVSRQGALREMVKLGLSLQTFRPHLAVVNGSRG